MPIASTNPNMLVRLIENPNAGKKANVPTIATGTVSNGIRVALQFWRKRKTTRITRPIASRSVTITSDIAA